MLGGMNLRSDRLKSVPTRLILYPLRMQPGGRGAELGTLRMDLWGCRLMLRSDRMKSGVRELSSDRVELGLASLIVVLLVLGMELLRIGMELSSLRLKQALIRMKHCPNKNEWRRKSG